MDSSDLLNIYKEARIKINSIGRFNFNFSKPLLFELDGKPIFTLASQHFHTILSESWRNVNESSINDVYELIRSVYESKWLLKEGLSYKTHLNFTFDEFLKLANSQFFYFRFVDDDNHYCFPLYSKINDENSVTGGFYHFLIRHFEQFSNIDLTSNDQTQFLPNDLLGILVLTAVYGEVEDKVDKNSGIEIFKKRVCKYFNKELNMYEDKKFLITLYYDKVNDYYSLNSFRRSS